MLITTPAIVIENCSYIRVTFLSGPNFRATLQQIAEFMTNQSEDVLMPANQVQERKYLYFALRDLSRASCFPALGTDYTFPNVWHHFCFEYCMIGLYAAAVICFVISVCF